MTDKLGPWITWALFLLVVYFYARPVLILLAGALMVALIMLGVVHKLERQGEEVSKSWNKSEQKGGGGKDV